MIPRFKCAVFAGRLGRMKVCLFLIYAFSVVAITAGADGVSIPPEAERQAVIRARIEKACADFERSLARSGAKPSVRELTACALGVLELGGDPARAEKLVRHAFGLQDMDTNSPGFGTVPWQEGHPEIKDANAIEFTMQPVGVMLLRHGGKLSEEFKRESVPHVRAGITAIRRHGVKVTYSNIYLKKLANLLMLGQAVGDADAVAEGKANFATWLAFTRTNGVAEYDSPTYSPIQADCLALAHNLTSDAALKAQLKSALDFYWADLAANYFPGRETLTGPASRDYSFLFSDDNVNWAYYLAGVRATPPGNTFLSDAVRAWTSARMGGYRPAPELLALARVPERVVRSRFGAAAGQDRYVWITPDFTIGSASAYYGAQDKRLCVELASAKKLPVVSFVVDEYDAPFGLVRALDRSGHNKPHHLQHLVAAVQEKGFLLALMDLAPATKRGEFTNLTSNVILPVKADQIWLDGKVVDVAKPFDLPANAASVVGLREGQAAVAVRMFAADGGAGQAAAWALQFDGNPQGGGRLVVHHYRGESRQLGERSLRRGLLLMAERCETEAEFGAFLKRAGQVELTDATQNGVWQVRAKSGPVELEAGLDLDKKKVAVRRVNGRDWPPAVFTVNGRDLAAETLDQGK